jgi:phosphate transport system permease protein
MATAAAIGSTILVMAPLIAIFAYLLFKGASSLNLAFFTQVPKPVGETGGGMANSILGSGILLAVASLMGVPIGIAGGIYIAEFGRNKRLANMVRFTADVLNGVPSIVMGIAIYTLIVVPQKHFSALAGGVALGIMMIPTITRTTEEMLLMVPLKTGVRCFPSLCEPPRPVSLPAACWPLPGWREKPPHCSLPRSETSSGVPA